jgi:predicted TIM-barrel fold metal-dependent hydrolase
MAPVFLFRRQRRRRVLASSHAAPHPIPRFPQTVTPKAIASVRHLVSLLEQNQDRVVIDADTHATDLETLGDAARERYRSEPGYYHGRPVSAEDLLREMEIASVDMAVIWQNPAATHYTDDPDRNADALMAANRYIRDSATRYPDRFIPAGWTDPRACGLGNALRIVESGVHELGFPVVKMNPAQNRYPIDSPEVLQVVDRIVELGAVPAFHFGADTPFTSVEGFETVAQRHPEHPILGVHMGGGGAGNTEAEAHYQKARELGLRRANIRYVWSARRDTHIENDLITYQLAGTPYSGNLFCGSDAPYGRMTWNFGGFRAMLASLMRAECHTDPRVCSNPGLFTPEAAQAYMGGNFARFMISACNRLLVTQGVSKAVRV